MVVVLVSDQLRSESLMAAGNQQLDGAGCREGVIISRRKATAINKMIAFPGKT